MKRTLSPTEHASQCAVFAWARMSECRYPDLRLMLHVPNGGYRNRIEAARFKAAGVRAGVPDVLLLAPRGQYHGLALELKAAGGKISPSQVVWLEELRNQGYFTHVSWDWEDAVKIIEWYLRLEVKKT